MPSTPPTCAGCGEPVADAAYCVVCRASGAQLPPLVTPAAQRTAGRRLHRGALLAVVLVVLAAGIVIALTQFKYFGPKVPFANGKGRLYYRGGVTKEQAQAAADYLTQTELFDKNPHATVDIQLLKTGDGYEVRFIVSKEDLDKDSKVGELGRIVAHELSREALGGAPCVAVFCDQKFEPLK